MHHHTLPADIWRLERAGRHASIRERPDRKLSREELAALPPSLRYDGPEEASSDLRPLDFGERSGNQLRPATFEQMVGQDRLKRLMRRVVDHARRTGQPLDHIMLAGLSGTGKTTLGQVIAHESGRRVFQVKAPVTHETLNALRQVCQDGDVIVVDELHQQVSGDRRGATQAADPEDFYHIMEDRRLPTDVGMVPYPAVTFIGCTTDIGLLPDAFVGRFPLTLTLDPYTPVDMTRLAHDNARQLGMLIEPPAALTFGLASRRNPRQLNTFVRNAKALGATRIDNAAAREVVFDLNGFTYDGLTPDMQGMLKCLLRSRRQQRDGTVVYQASMNTIATALGHSRDTKEVVLRVEPFLIAEGLVAVTHGGRTLTDRGLQRAMELT